MVCVPVANPSGTLRVGMFGTGTIGVGRHDRRGPARERAGGEQRGPLGQTVIGGVITSSILTLVVVPVVYTVLEDWAHSLRRVFRRKGK
jgi:hypothetical protein